MSKEEDLIMRVIARKYHAIFDYISGVLLIVSPWLFSFIEYDAPTRVAYFIGIVVIIISFNTDYEGGVTKMLNMSLHLNIDVIGGIFLVASPWIFGFSEETFLFHLIIGALQFISGILTVNKSQNPDAEHLDDVNHNSRNSIF